MLDGGREIVSCLQNDHPHLSRLFYSILPICGLLAWGTQTLTAEEFTTLTKLATLPEGRFFQILKDANRFATRVYEDVPASPEQREAVLDRLGQYGILQTYRILQSGLNNQKQLTQELLRSSGLPPLKDLILSHFGNRAFLIKRDTALRQIEIACFWARQRASVQGTDREILKRVEGSFGQLRDQEQGFSKLSVLHDYYQGKLPFTSDEVQQLLQVTGEFGLSDRQRLGLPNTEGDPTASELQETLKKARTYAGYWQRHAIDPGAIREVEKAAGILGDAYDRISYRTMETMKRFGFTPQI